MLRMIKHSKIKAISLVFGLFFISPEIYANDTYQYEPVKVTLKGIVGVKTFHSAPGYGENKNDKQIKVPILSLPQPINVDANRDTASDDSDSQSVNNITDLQVFSYNGPVTFRGCAVLTGSLMHQETAEHYTRVLLIVDKVVASSGCKE